MQNAEPVQLRQVRDFGQVLGTTFIFLRQNLRMLRMVAFIAAPFLIIGSLLANFMPLYMLQQADDVGSVLSSSAFGVFGIADSWLYILPGWIISITGMVLLSASIHEYLRAYHQGEHLQLTTGVLFGRSWAQFGPYLGSNLLVGLIMFASLILCILPVVFVGPLFALTFSSHAVERTGGWNSLGRSNALVKGDYWSMVGLFLVIWIIWYICNLFLQLPFIIVGVIVGVTTGFDMMKDPTMAAEQMMGWMVWLQAGMAMIQGIAYTITLPIIGICFFIKYFSRVEEMEGHGMREKIAGFEQM